MKTDENVNRRKSVISPSQWEQLKTLLPPEEIQAEEPMKKHTTFRIGGPAESFLSPSTEEELTVLMETLRQEKIPFFILGNGSNLLAGDLGISGAVINMSRLRGTRAQGNELEILAGTPLHAAFQAALKNGLSGMEFASGIPGSLGGAVFMNAGAYGGEMKDILKSVRILTMEGDLLDLPAENLRLGYRHSLFMELPEEKRPVVVAATVTLQPGDPKKIAADAAELNRRRREKQPLEYPSAGSTFKRPEGYYAGKLISDSGLKGFQIGDAEVSEKHAGFLINRGSATAQDMQRLIRHVQETVKQKYNVELQPEVRMVGTFC